MLFDTTHLHRKLLHLPGWYSSHQGPFEIYRVRLEDVVVAAQARLVARQDGFDWIWEGVWSARLARPPAPEGPSAWPASAPALEVRYKEYVRPSGDATGAFWQGLLAPLALGADIGAAFLEGEGSMVDSVAERQRQRN